MTKITHYNEMKKIWHQIARHKDEEISGSFQLEIHQKLMDIIHLGHYYYYIVNLARVEIEHVSEHVLAVLGFEEEAQFTVQYIYENIHPEDKKRFVLHEQKVTEFFNKLAPDKVLKYKVSYDYRLRRTDGSYIWILMQTVTIQTNNEGAVIRVLGIQTDITHLKKDNTPSGLSFIGLEGEPSFMNVEIPEIIQLDENELFTSREKQILRMMVQGKTSSEIAQHLTLSLHTVNTHRKNILSKSGCRNISELLVLTVNKRWAD